MEAVQLTALPAAKPVLVAPAAPSWDAFETLVRRHHDGLRRFAHRLLADAHHTEDVLQDSYLKAYRAFPRLNGGGEAVVAAWLYRIVYRSSRRWQASRRRLAQRSSSSTARASTTGRPRRSSACRAGRSPHV